MALTSSVSFMTAVGIEKIPAYEKSLDILGDLTGLEKKSSKRAYTSSMSLI